MTAGEASTGTADVLWRNAPMIREFDPEALVVLSADAVYSLDYGALVEEHMATDSVVTMVTTEVDPEDAGRYGVMRVEGERVTEYVYKPDEPATNLISNEVFVFRPKPMLDELEAIVGEHGEDDLEDVGNELLPRLVDAGSARQHRFDGYWRDVGTVDAFHECHMELLGEPPPIDLDDLDWPILTHATARRASSRILDGAKLERAQIAPAARIAGEVARSVVGRGAVIEAGAVVRDSVLLPGAIVRSGARVERAIVDDGVEICEGVSVGERDGDIALVGLGAKVEEDVPSGGRFPEVTS